MVSEKEYYSDYHNRQVWNAIAVLRCFQFLYDMRQMILLLRNEIFDGRLPYIEPLLSIHRLTIFF